MGAPSKTMSGQITSQITRRRSSIRAPNCVCSHALRVFSSQSPALAARDFRAPPFSGAFALWRLNHCSPLHSIPSLPRSENIRWAWGFSPFATPRWMASV